MLEMEFLFIKRIFTNKRRLFTILTGLILCMALISGISIYVDNTSTKILDNYLFNNEDRLTDVFIDNGFVGPQEASALLWEWRNNGQGDYAPFREIDVHESVNRWQLTEINPTYVDLEETPNWNPDRSTIALGLNETFNDSFPNFFEIIEGEFNVSTVTIPKKVYNSTGHLIGESTEIINYGVVQQSFAEEFNLTIGSTFEIFSWKALMINSPEEYKDINWKKTINVSAIVSDHSKLITEFPEMVQFDYEGGIFLNQMLQPDFYDDLRITRDDEGQYSLFFKSYSFIRMKNSIVDRTNPQTTITLLETLSQSLKNYYDNHYNLEFVSVQSSMLETIEDYAYWLQEARFILLLFSLPVIFLGWYLLNFSFKYTFNERRTELSGLKSRGFSNFQVLYMLIFESIVMGLIGAIMGLGLGIYIGSVLDSIQSQNQSINDLDFLFNVLIDGLLQITESVYITPLTLGLVLITSFVLMIISSIFPIISIINLPIDVMARGDDLKEQEEQQGFLSNDFALAILGFFLVIGIPTIPLITRDNDFVMILGAMGFIIFLLGSLFFMASIARQFPTVLERYIKIDWPQLFITAREMSRQSSKTSAAFIVLSLTMAFGIISSVTIATTETYQNDNFAFDIGSDVRIDILSQARESNSHIKNLNLLTAKNTKFTAATEIASAARMFIGRMPSTPSEKALKEFSQYAIFSKSIEDYQSVQRGGIIVGEPTKYAAERIKANLLFINGTNYRNTAFHRSDFLIDITWNELFDKWVQNPNDYAILDINTARDLDVTTGDQLLFTANFGVAESIFFGNKTIIALANYFSPGFVADQSHFIVVDFSQLLEKSPYLTNSPADLFLLKLKNIDSSDRVVQTIEAADSANLFQGIDGVSSIRSEMSTRDADREFGTILSVLTLDFYYALLISAIGFFIVLEIRVEEKKKDIAVIKSLGFSNFQTNGLIILEGAISMVVATLTGVFIGWFTSILINFVFLPTLTLPKLITYNINYIQIQIGLGLLSAFIGSLIPALLTNRYRIGILLRRA